MTVLLITAALCCLVVYGALRATRDRTEYIYYDENEVLPECPKPWGIDDYKPWPGKFGDE